ncbi:MAG: cupin domain-containing protein [Firmicutes bacterium]|jgi:mannose-6-phosphate isomerase-like protein (cupin superfamily)|nr:cupin domain-containing protein [Bacillota bacterium]
MKVSKHSAEHYTWGGECDGWHLLKDDNLAVIQERMPPGTSEVRHYHENARQFFFVLAGEVCVETEGETITLAPHEGVYVRPGITHKVLNRSGTDSEFLVVSSPSTRGDRVAVETKAAEPIG